MLSLGCRDDVGQCLPVLMEEAGYQNKWPDFFFLGALGAVSGSVKSQQFPEDQIPF